VHIFWRRKRVSEIPVCTITVEFSSNILLLTAQLCTLTALFTAFSFAQVNVLTANYGPDRTNANLQEIQLTPSNVAPGSFGALGVFPADGEIFSQPLYVSGVAIPGQGTHNVLFVTTQHNSVYAYDADRVAPPVLLWHVSLGASVPASTLTSSTGAYTDVTPEIGILSTGVADPQGGVLYVVAETLQKDGPVFQLHALDLGSGQERMNGPVVISATVPGIGAGSNVDGTLTFDPTQHIQRPGLLLMNGAVSVAFGSHGDGGVWHGWLMKYNAADLAKQLGVFQVTPAGQGGAIWQSGRGLAADDAGNIYFITGNGDYDGKQNFGESFVKLSGSSLAVSDWYTPANWQMLTDNDYDLSAGPAFLPGTHTLIGGDKSGNLYVVNGDSMGHLDTGSSAQVFQAVGGFIFNFAVWGRPDAAYIYVRDGDGSLNCYRVVGGSFDPTPLSVSSSLGGSSRIGMAISANGGLDGTGILWATSGAYHDSSTPGILHAFDATNLASELWNSGMAPQDDLGGFVKFVSPTVVNGKVYAASSRSVVVYGLLAGAQGGQPPPVVAAALNAASYSQDAVSPGELITIFGSNLGPPNGASLQLDSDGNVLTILSDTQVQFDGIPAAMIYAGANQVSAVVPFGISSDTSQVVVLYQDQSSAAFPVTVAPATPGLFSVDSSGSGQALAINQDGTINSSDNPAPAGSMVVLYATGGGQAAPQPADGSVVSADNLPLPVLPVTAQIGGRPAEVLYAGGAPGMVAGILQVNLRVPTGVATGSPAPVVLQVGGQSSQGGLTIAVR
jgi:uncharacterized protein (TIGR03437 family)